jgi:hypothetical protein
MLTRYLQQKDMKNCKFWRRGESSLYLQIIANRKKKDFMYTQARVGIKMGASRFTA